jgi:hypothetical protein
MGENATMAVAGSLRAERDFPRFDTPNVLWFFGAFAMSFATDLVLSQVPKSHHELWEFLVAVAFVVVYAAIAGLLLWAGWWVPGGLTAAVAVSIVPAAGFGLTSLIRTFPKGVPPTQTFSWSIFLIGIATIAAGLIAFALTRFSFLFSTVAASISLTAQFLLPGIDKHPSTDAHFVMAIVVGAAMVVLGLLLDVIHLRRDAFWFHAIGFANVAVALGYYAVNSSGDTNRGWIPMIIAGGVVLLAAAPLRRATWAVYGVLGFYAPIVHWLTNGVRPNSAGYSLLLLAIGTSIFVLGLAMHRFGRIWTNDQRSGNL